MSGTAGRDPRMDTIEAAVRDGDFARAQDILATFSDTPEGNPQRLALEAACAAGRGDFDEAVRIWRRCDELFGLVGEDLGAFGLALEQSGRIPDALSVYRRLQVTREGDCLGAWEEARLQGLLGEHAAVLNVLEAALQTAPSRKIEIRLRAVRARRAAIVGRFAEALADYVLLARLQPQNPRGLLGQVQVHLKNFDEASARAALAEAAARHPDDMRLLGSEARLLLQYGDDDAFVVFVGKLAALPLSDDVYRGLISNLFRSRVWFFTEELRRRLLAAAGDAGRQEILLGVLSRQVSSPDENLSAARKAMDGLAAHPDSPAGLAARVRLATALIEAGLLAEAETMAGQLAISVRDWPHAPAIMGELLEWMAVRRGDVEAARRAYWRRRRMHAHNDRTDELDCVRMPPGAPPEVAVVCQLRNERVMLPAFFQHYRALGIERFVMIDNGSTDGSFEHLLAQPDVELYRTYAPFRRAESGNAWTNPLIGRPDYVRTLCLRVDADEHLVYPHYETRPIAMLWRHMQAEGSEVLAGFMLDMFPETTDQLQAEDFVAASTFYDLPPEPAPATSCPYVAHRGGPRRRFMDGPAVLLTKCSGLRGGGAVEQVHMSHFASPATVSSVSMALLHYKFRPDVFERAVRVAGERQYASGSQSYSRYGSLQTDQRRMLRSDDTRVFNGSAGLVANGVLRSTPAWDDGVRPAPVRAG